MKFEDTIEVFLHNRTDNFLIAKATVDLDNGERYNCHFQFEAEIIGTTPSGSPNKFWNCKLCDYVQQYEQRGTWKKRKVSRSLRRALFFIPHQLVKQHLYRCGWLD